jgi:hypothetical protein
VASEPHLDRLVEAGARRAEIDRACHAIPPASRACGSLVGAIEATWAKASGATAKAVARAPAVRPRFKATLPATI